MADPQGAEKITPARRALIMTFIMMATVIFIMNQTNVIVALPHMQGTFSATQDQITWILTSFILALTIMTAATGFLAGRFGRKRLYVLSILGFTVASFFCATASTLETEVLFRALQGAAGAPIIPLSQAIVLDIYPKERHGMALGLWGVGITVGPVFGPILGGYVTETASWPWVFYFNLPVGAVATLGIVAFLPDTSQRNRRKLDWLGFAALSVALAALQFLLNRGERLDWFESLEISLSAAAFLLGLYVFAIHTATTPRPFVDRALLGNRNVMLGFALIFAWGCVLHSPLVLLSLRLQGLENYPVMAAGFLMAPRGLGGVLAMFLVGPLLRILNPKYIVSAGFGFVALATWYMSHWPMHAAEHEVIVTAFGFGFGIALAWVPLSMLTFQTLSTAFRTDGTAFFNLLLNMGSGVGITLAVLVFTKSVQIGHEQLATHVTPFNKLFQGQSFPHMWDMGTRGGLKALDSEIVAQATTIAFNNAFLLVALTALAAIPFIYLLGGGARLWAVKTAR
ncbi:MAG: DHA2 family efflux MFS transporter permease subunit [Alphaproteobacteria bacterium]